MSRSGVDYLNGGTRGLPQLITSLVGRARETTDVLNLIGRPDVRLVTLVGPGGVGKTRLATHIADQAADLFADGAAFVNLAAITDPALVPTLIAATLGLPDRGPLPCNQILLSHVASKEMLLVLDNLEHILEATPLISELLLGAPGVTILATSRVLLRLSGEHAYPVPPLDVPNVTEATALDSLELSDAMRLFVDRARAVRPSLELTQSTALAIAQICQLLDGLPLAIELAAARANVLSPQAMAARLERRLPLLTGGARDRPQRQQTMRDAIAWSYDLLSSDEQALFRRLSVFAGSFSLEAAESASQCLEPLELDVLEGIGSLVDKSLLRTAEREDDAPRFAMLQTIREFAQDKLDSAGERAEAEAAHAGWFLDLARRVDREYYTAAEPEWVWRLQPERPNFRAALAWYLAHDPRGQFLELSALIGRLWYKWERYSEGRKWLEQASAIAEKAGPSTSRALILDNLAKLTVVQTEGLSPATSLITRSLADWRAVDDARGIARETVTLAELYRFERDAERAVPLYEEGLARLEALGTEDFWISTARRGLATVELQRGNTDRAESLFRESLDAARASGSAWAITTALYGVGLSASVRGNHLESLPLFRESLAVAWELRDRVAVALALPALAEAMIAAGQPERAAQLFGATAAVSAILTSEGLGLPPSMAGHDGSIAALRTRIGEAAYDTAWSAGRHNSVGSAVAMAISLAERTMAELAGAVNGSGGPRAAALPGGLSEREAEVLRLAASGLSTHQMADRLFLSPNTIRAHLHRIYAKLEITNRAEATRYATDHGLL